MDYFVHSCSQWFNLVNVNIIIVIWSINACSFGAHHPCIEQALSNCDSFYTIDNNTSGLFRNDHKGLSRGLRNVDKQTNGEGYA